jgi:putrescine aminotransferase
VPDVLVLAKSLSGSIAPIGATVTSSAIYDRAYGAVDRFDLHSSTFGGNAFSCVAALETLRILSDEELVANSVARGEQLLNYLRAKLNGHPLVRDIRGRGLLVGIEFGPTDRGLINKLAPSLVESISKKMFGQWVALKLLERGIICQPAAFEWNILKLEPPLTVQPAEVDRFVNVVAEVLDDYQGIVPILRDVTGRVGKQFIAGWTF